MSSRPFAWQPLTFGGVAAFARATFGRLVVVQAVVTLLTAACVIFAFELAWAPSIRRVIEELPTSGAIESGRLQWTSSVPQRFGAGPHLGFLVDPEATGLGGRVADVELVIGRDTVGFHPLPHVVLALPPTFSFPLNRPGLEPRWGAWHGAVLALLAAGVVAWLFLSWWALATIYALPVRLLAFYADRHVTLGGAWRVAAAALLPGALFMGGAIFAYAWQRIDLVRLVAGWGIHMVLGWVYAVAACWRLPHFEEPSSSPPNRNPFASPPADLSSPPLT